MLLISMSSFLWCASNDEQLFHDGQFLSRISLKYSAKLDQDKTAGPSSSEVSCLTSTPFFMLETL